MSDLYLRPSDYRRRTWRNTLFDLVVLAALCALLWWLYGLVSRAAGGAFLVPQEQGYLLAMAPMPMGVMMGVGAMALCVLAWCASRRTWLKDEKALIDRFGGYQVQQPVTALDVARIASAAAVLAGEIRLNATLALAGDETMLPEIIKTAERQQLTLINLKRSVSAYGIVPEGQEWDERMGGSGS